MRSESRPDAISPMRIEQIQKRLLEWFRQHARDLPWRRTRDPYAILVSEIMLQQTQVDRVVPYFERFLERYPTVDDLAAAPAADVIRIWSGLGYNRRAVNLQRAAVAVSTQFGGTFPDQPDELRKLPGVGAYTAGALAAFAFERDVVFLDTNMHRVVSRLIFGNGSPSDKEVLAAAALLLPKGRGWEWNQALIEFGALQCTAKRPACIVCPLNQCCAAFPTMQSTLAEKRTAARKKNSDPFETSSRYFRGRIVEVLRALPPHDNAGIALTQLGPQVRDGFSPQDLPWLQSLVEGLQRDGLAAIAEESPRYDADSDQSPPSPRVRLP